MIQKDIIKISPHISISDILYLDVCDSMYLYDVSLKSRIDIVI